MNKKEEKEFKEIAMDMEDGYHDPYTITHRDMYGNDKKYSFGIIGSSVK